MAGRTAEQAPVRVVQHSLLGMRGGAARVAHLLDSGLLHLKHQAYRTVEFPDFPTPQDQSRVREATIRQAADWAQELGALLHLHSTQDLAGALGACADRNVRPVITLHDSRLLTGGCVHPLDCPGWKTGCLSPCPLGFENALKVQNTLRQGVLETSPVLIAPSGWLARRVRQVFSGFGCRVIPNGVEWPGEPVAGTHEKLTARNAFGIAQQARAAVFLAHGGEGAAFKDGPAWQNIWNQIKTAEPRAVGFFVGNEGGEQAACDPGRDLVRLPYLDRDKLHMLLTAADVLVYPSIADNHPLAVLEAMSCNTAVAAMGAGGVAEQVHHEQTGLLVEPGDRKGLAKAAIRLLSDTQLARRLGDEAWRVGRKHFSHMRMTRDYLKLYSG